MERSQCENCCWASRRIHFLSGIVMVSNSKGICGDAGSRASWPKVASSQETGKQPKVRVHSLQLFKTYVNHHSEGQATGAEGQE